MNKTLNLTLCFLFVAVVQSCIEINSSGYSTLSEQEKAHVKVCRSSLNGITKDGNLYKVNVKQVKSWLQHKHMAIVYAYLPFCSGESGRDPIDVKKKCDERHLDLIVISSVYDDLFPICKKTNFPIFVIDQTPYKTDNYQKYSYEFYSALTNTKSDNGEWETYHLFKNGQYIESYSSLENIANLN